MLRINNRGFNRSYVYGGSGIFDSIAKTISSVIGKEAVKRAATQAVQKAATEAGKKLGEKAVTSLISKSKEPLTSQSQEILRKYTAPIEEEFNLNNLIAGSAIRIEDYVKMARPNKFGLKK